MGIILLIFIALLFILFSQNYLLLLILAGGVIWYLARPDSDGGKKKPSEAPDASFIDKLITIRENTDKEAVKKACTVIITYLEQLKESQEKEEAAGKAEEEAPRPKAASQAASSPAFEMAPSIDIHAAFHSLQNINIFLYLGAFFVVVAAGIFVSFTYEQLSGLTKTIFLAVFALTFYITGVFFYLKTKKIRPAGLTFTGIGLVLIPLVGLGAYNFIYQGQMGNYVWFGTSLVTLFFYALSVFLLRKTFIAYLMTFTALSLVESSLSLFDVPLYYFTWGMALTSMLFIIAARYKNLFEEVGESFKTSANIFLPVSLASSLYLTNEFGVGQLGINFILSALFYLCSSFLTENVDERDIYFGLAAGGFPAGILFLLQDYRIGDPMIANILGATGVAYVCLLEIAAKYWNDRRITLLSFASGAILLLAVYLSRGVYPGTYFILALSLVLNLYGAKRIKQELHIVFGTFSALIVLFPWVGNVPVGHMGIVLLLASVFYFAAHMLTHVLDMKYLYLTLSLVVLPAGLYSLLRDYHIADLTIAIIMAVLGFLYVGAIQLVGKYWKDERIEILSVLGGAVTVAGVVISREILPAGYLLLTASLLLNAYEFRKLRNRLHILLGTAALVISFFLYGAYPLGHTGIIFLYGAGFYFVIHLLRQHKELKVFYLALSLVLFPAGIYSLLLDYSVQDAMMAASFCSIGILYVAATEIARKYWDALRIQLLSVIGGILSFLAVTLVLDIHTAKVFTLLAAALVNAYGFYRTKNLFHVILGLTAFLLLPYAMFETVTPIETAYIWTSLLYIVAAACIVGLRKGFRAMKEKYAADIAAVGYLIGFAAALYYIYVSANDTAMLFVFLLVSFSIFAISYFEKVELMILLSVILFYLATMKIVAVGGLTGEAYSLQFALTGLILYGAGHFLDEARNKILRYSGIVGPYLGAIFNFSYDATKIQPIMSLFTAGGLSFAEADREKSTAGRYVSAAILVLAIEWLYVYLRIEETQVYTVTWALYFGALAYLRYLKRDKESQNLLTIVSLGLLTIPLAWQALNDQAYALFLILEGLALVAGGVAINYKLMRNWGLIALVGTVIYQLRDFFLGLPSWAIFGLIGILILAASIFLLSRRKE